MTLKLLLGLALCASAAYAAWRVAVEWCERRLAKQRLFEELEKIERSP